MIGEGVCRGAPGAGEVLLRHHDVAGAREGVAHTVERLLRHARVGGVQLGRHPIMRQQPGAGLGAKGLDIEGGA